MTVWLDSQVAKAATEDQPLMIVGQAAIGGETKIKVALAGLSAMAVAETIAKAETTGEKMNIIEAVRAEQVRFGLDETDGRMALKIVLATMTEEANKVSTLPAGPTKLLKKAKTVLVLMSQRPQTSVLILFCPLETTLRSVSLEKG